MNVYEHDLDAPKEDIIAWKNDPMTKLVLKVVKQEVAESNRRMGGGETLGENIVQDTARAVGYVEGLGFLTTILEAANFIEDEEEARHERRQAKVEENS